jgi:hypothetical protein
MAEQIFVLGGPRLRTEFYGIRYPRAKFIPRAERCRRALFRPDRNEMYSNVLDAGVCRPVA